MALGYGQQMQAGEVIGSSGLWDCRIHVPLKISVVMGKNQATNSTGSGMFLSSDHSVLALPAHVG
jgi:hypothetical protein